MKVKYQNAFNVVNLSERLGQALVTFGPEASTGVNFVDGGGSDDSIVLPGSLQWEDFGFAAGKNIVPMDPETAANNGSFPINSISGDTLYVPTGSLTADTGDTSVHFVQVDYDPNAQALGITSDASGTTTTTKNSVSVDGWREGFSCGLGLATSLLSRWKNDGLCDVLLRGIIVTSGPNNKNYWQGCGLISGAPGAGTEGNILGYYRTGTTDIAARLFSTADAPTSGAVTEVRMGYMFSQSGAASGNGAVVVGGGIPITQGRSDDYSAAHIILAAGCETSTNDGPHSAKVLWKAAVVDWGWFD